MGENYLDLFKWDFKAKGLVVVRVEGVLLDCRLLLLQPLAVLHQVDLHIRICGGKLKSNFTYSTKSFKILFFFFIFLHSPAL